jgi:hypothetical protein
MIQEGEAIFHDDEMPSSDSCSRISKRIWTKSSWSWRWKMICNVNVPALMVSAGLMESVA